MTKKEIMEFIDEEFSQGNEQILVLVSEIDNYLPMFRKYPDGASIKEIERYNSLVRSNIHEKRILDKILINY